MLIPIILNGNEKKSCLICKKFITEKCENIDYYHRHNSHCNLFEYAKCKNTEYDFIHNSHCDFSEDVIYIYKQIYNE